MYESQILCNAERRRYRSIYADFDGSYAWSLPPASLVTENIWQKGHAFLFFVLAQQKSQTFHPATNNDKV